MILLYVTDFVLRCLILELEQHHGDFRHSTARPFACFLVTVAKTKSLTTAASQYGISMGAASRRLSHLREVFDDELFIRSGVTMLPTMRMRRLLPRVLDLLAAGGVSRQPSNCSAACGRQRRDDGLSAAGSSDGQGRTQRLY